MSMGLARLQFLVTRIVASGRFISVCDQTNTPVSDNFVLLIHLVLCVSAKISWHDLKESQNANALLTVYGT